MTDFSDVPALLVDIDDDEARIVASRITATINSAPVRSEVAMYGWALSLANACRQLGFDRAGLDELLDKAFEVVDRHHADQPNHPPIPTTETT